MRINETVLEMHFHTEVLNLIKRTLGLGPKAAFNFYKYSPQLEKFVGFDQAFVMSQDHDDALFKALKGAAQSSSYRMGPKFVGLFLQYKVVQLMQKKSRKNPPPVTSSPFYRASLYTSRSAENEKSQHELLYHLEQNNPGAFVYYACPMLFDKAKLYERADLSELRLPRLSSCPSAYLDNDKHFIFFDSPTSPPIWKSEPVMGEAISPEEMAIELANYLRETTPQQSVERMNSLLSFLRVSPESTDDISETAREILADALTIISIDMGPALPA